MTAIINKHELRLVIKNYGKRSELNLQLGSISEQRIRCNYNYVFQLASKNQCETWGKFESSIVIIKISGGK